MFNGTSYGIHVRTGFNNVLEDNAVVGAGGNGYTIEAVGTELCDNLAQNCGGDGFFVDKDCTRVALERCTAVGSTLIGLHNLGTRTAVVDCEFTDSEECDLLNAGSFSRFESNSYRDCD